VTFGAECCANIKAFVQTALSLNNVESKRVALVASSLDVRANLAATFDRCNIFQLEHFLNFNSTSV
jgi:hypothetical protein